MNCRYSPPHPATVLLFASRWNDHRHQPEGGRVPVCDAHRDRESEAIRAAGYRIERVEILGMTHGHSHYDRRYGASNPDAASAHAKTAMEGGYVFIYVIVGYAAHDHGKIEGIWTFVNVDDARVKLQQLQQLGEFDLVLARTILGQMLTPQGLAEILEVDETGTRTKEVALPVRDRTTPA